MAERELDRVDFDMIHRRSEILIRMCNEGMISQEVFMDAFESQKRSDVIEEERAVYEHPTKHVPEDSPYYRLLSQYLRRGGTFKPLTSK